MMAQVNLARSSLFRDQRNFAIQFSLEICTANFISNSRNLEVGIFLSSVTWSSFLQLTYKKGFCAGVNTYLLSHQSVLIVTTYFILLHNCVLLSSVGTANSCPFSSLIFPHRSLPTTCNIWY